MKSFIGVSKNIYLPTLCRISNNNYNKELNNIYIRNNSLEKTFQINDDLKLNEKDIVLLESEKGTILFNSKSCSNVLLLTEKCNCNCLMCPQPPNKTNSVDYVSLSESILKLIDQNTELIAITGGEPTLIWDDLVNILLKCNEYIPMAKICLLSNGRIFSDYAKAKVLSEIITDNIIVAVPLYADVSSIHDQIVRSPGAFWETTEGLFNLERANVHIEIRNVISKINYSRLPQWGEFVYRTFPFVDHLAIMGIEMYGNALINLDKTWIDPVDYNKELVKCIQVLNQRNMPVSIYNHQLCTLPKALWRFSSKAISEWKNIYLSECNGCIMKSHCGGFFESNRNFKSRNIGLIKN
jgi:His-Xaa-Ser system radical SAM maturase HxsC